MRDWSLTPGQVDALLKLALGSPRANTLTASELQATMVAFVVFPSVNGTVGEDSEDQRCIQP